MKRSTKQLLSMLLAIVMVVGLMAPAMAATPMMGEVAETPVEAEAPAAGRPTTKAPAKAGLSATKLTYAAALTDLGEGAEVTLATETKITSGDVDAAVSLYVGSDKYKTNGNNGYFEGQTNYVVGNGNPVTADDAVDADGNPTGKKAAPAPLTTADGNHFPVTGCYYKFVAHKAGALEVVAMMNADKSIFVFDAGTDGTTATAINGKDGSSDTKLAAKGDPYIEKFAVEADHIYYFFCTGSKAGLYGFTFEEGATVDTTPVITLASPAEATTKEVKQNEGLAIAVAATISFKAQSAIQYQWYKKGATDTAVEGGTTASLTIDTTNEIAGDQYYCVVSAAGATSVTSPVITVKVNKADPVEEKPEATATEWVANIADIPGTAITVDTVDGKETTAETVVDAKVMGITFSVGADKYKMLGAEGDIPAALTGKTNPSPSPKTGVPTSGTYYKFAMTMDGELTINNVANKKNIWIYDIDAEGTATAMEGYNPLACDPAVKSYDPFTIEVKKGHTYVMAAEGSKAIIAGFSFNPVIEGSWTANIADIPGTAITVDTVDGKEVTAETVVDAKVPGVTMSVGADKYKMLGAEGDIPAALTGKTNPSPSPKTGVPTSGTYYKFAISMDGELTINNVANKKNIWIYDIDAEGTATAMEGYNPLACDPAVKSYDPFTIGVQKGHTYVMAAEGSKAIIAGFSFSSGKTKRDTKPWTATDICDGKTITVTPVANADGTIDVTVENLGVGEIKSNDVLWKYADELAVEMYSDTQLLETETTKLDGMTHKLTFTPAATGNYTFKASAKRASEATTIDSEMSAAVSFTLPLAVPVINSVASNGLEADKDTASVTVSWTAVPEANSYNLYCRAKGAADWGTAIPVSATEATNVNVIVPGLTVGAEYEFAAEAIRNAGTINGVTVTAETTAKSATESAVVTGTKQIAWTTKVFGTSATADYNSVIEGTYTADFSVVDEQGNVLPGTDHKEVIEGLTGDLNTDPEGRILLSSREGAGKIQEPTGADGLLFHYTTVPAGYNYSLKAKVHVTRWMTRDTQNGLGLAVMDRVPAKSQTGSVGNNAFDYWNNSYMVGAARLGFSYDTDTGKAYYSESTYGDPGADAYTKYSYYMGLCSITKHGTPKGYDASGIAGTFLTRRFPLDTRIARDGVTAKYNGQNNRFNTIGNFTKVPAGWSSQSDENGKKLMPKYEMTDFILELKKTPTGYVSTAWDKDGNFLGTNTEYYAKGAAELSSDGDTNPYTHFSDPAGAKDLSGRAELGEKVELMDASAEYVGLFTSRDTDAMFSDVEFKMWPQSEDKEAVQTPPTTVVRPTLSISSGTSSNTKDFTLSVATNVDGWVTITQNGAVIATDLEIEGGVRLDKKVELKAGSNNFSVSFKMDLDQVNDADWPPFTELDTVNLPKDATSTVSYMTYFQQLNNIYVAPYANSTGRGTRSSPVDVHTAVSVVAPGQNIILLPGVYKLTKTIRIGRGMNGTEEKPIYFMADPDRAEGEKVVLNGQGSAGTVLVHGSDWWVFKDFEVVGSSSGSTAVQISGNHNIIQSVDAHDNGSTGFTVGRLSSSDKIPTRPTANSPASEVTDWGEWPCFNTFINCSSYRNYDSGYNGADGFGAKQTVGEGNVFDGCVAYWNADDGWDLFAKSQADMGPIGAVTMKNCITFQNGYEVRKIIDPTTQKCEMEADGYTPKMNLDADGKIVLADAGNGNGFKMGGSHLPGAHVIENSYSFYNKAKGFDSNNGPDISVIGCTGYNNGDENVGLGSNHATAYVVKNVVSFKDDKCPKSTDGKVKMKDSIEDGAANQIDKATYYAWDGKKSSNGTKEITADNFASRDFDNTQWINGAPRDENGTLQMGDFLKLVNVTDAGAGELTNTETPVETPTIVPDPEPEGGSTGGSSSGNGGTASAPKPGEKPDEGDKPAPEKTYTANKTTNINGDTEIVVKDNNGEVVADVKIPATIPAPETKFDDVPEDHWAEQSINNMAALGVVNGVGNNKYDMDSAVTRGTIATMLYRFASGKAGKTNPFTDVAAGQWYTDAIAWAADSGVVTGYDATTFGPNDTITREQLAVMLYRFAKLIGMDGTVTDSALADYNDVASVDDWAAEGMAWCVSKGIINGVSADTLSPTTSATRAQTATMLDRFIGLMK